MISLIKFPFPKQKCLWISVGWIQLDDSMKILKYLLLLCWMNTRSYKFLFISEPIKHCRNGWMAGWLAILRPFQQYFSHIRTMGRWLWKATWNGTPFTIEKISVVVGARTRDREISRPALNILRKKYMWLVKLTNSCMVTLSSKWYEEPRYLSELSVGLLI